MPRVAKAQSPSKDSSAAAELWIAFHLGRACGPAHWHSSILAQLEPFVKFNGGSRRNHVVNDRKSIY